MPKVPTYTLAWSGTTQAYTLSESRDSGPLNIVPDSPDWFVWLDHVCSFAFWGRAGHYIARKEAKQRGDRYWYACLAVGDKRSKTYLGKTAALSLARLEQVAQLLQARSAEHQAQMHSSQQGPEELTVAQLSRPPILASTLAHLQVDTVVPTNPQQQGELLLSTKLYVPRPRQQLVSRPHLTERLSQAMEHALILISAPAGFGKTTLLTQWFAQGGPPVAWLSVDEQDNDPSRFLRYVIAALQRLDPHIGTTALALLHVSHPVPAESVLTKLINDVASRKLDDFALVLDDYHLIEAEFIHHALTFLLEHLPPQMHVILSTRTDPPLPLARLRARGQLSELRAAQLRFDTWEVSAFLCTVPGLELAEEDTMALQSQTEGWVAGLQFAALSLQQRPDVAGFVAGFSGSHRFVLDYLCQEVLAQQSEAVQSFLLHTCILERLCGPLCEAVTGDQQGEGGYGQAVLEALDRANLFVVSLDDERGWYRYHHLFAQVLRNRLQQTEPELLPALHCRASIWYQRQGLLVEAVQHALAAPDLERATNLIEQHGLVVSGWGQAHTVLGWLKSLPEILVRTRPRLCTIYACMLVVTHQLEGAQARLQDAERSLESNTPVEQVRTIQGQMALVRGNIIRHTGDPARHVAFAYQALDLLPETERLWRSIALASAAQAYLVSGDVTPRSEGLLVATVAPAHSSGHLCMQLRSLTLLARLHMLQGRLREAASTYRQTVQVIGGQEVLAILPGSPAYCFGLGDLLREWNRLEEAERLLSRGMGLHSGPLMAFADDVLLGCTALARLQQARGDNSGALSTLDAFIQVAHQRHFVPWLVACVLAVRAQVELARGNLSAASQWAEQCGLSLEDEDLAYLHEREYLTLVRVYIARGRELQTRQGARQTQPLLTQVRDLIKRLREQAESSARMSSVIELLILQALTLELQREHTSALRALERALVLAEPQGYMRLFLDEGAPLVALLRRASAQGIAPNYLPKLLAAYSEQAGDYQQTIRPEPLLKPLTRREREVLRLLTQGESNHQMAQRLVLSVGTIKKYVYGICGKLGVQSRTQAVIKARTLNLL
ncbi:MAG: hypothetical protein JO202_15615 [Ktedonobacteraceae bacterium]|nr:hypothetical protein [Ktedonobacteraceae bacterium]